MRKALLAAVLIAAGAIIGTAADARTWGGDASRTVAAGAQVAQLAPAAPASRPANARPDLGDKWLDAKGQYRFPPDEGFWSPPRDATLAPGTMIDRYGFPGGRFLSPVGTSYEARALPYDKAKMPYYRYEVLKPLPAKEGLAVPWFDEPGGGVQYMVEKPVQQLISEGYLKEVAGK
jgi:hypothetical protein